MTIFSPQRVGRLLTRQSSWRRRPLILMRIMMRPSCGKRFSLISRRARILMREMMASRSFDRRLHQLLQNAVHAEADAVFLLVGFEVNVAGPGLHGFPQDDVDQLDDGRLFGGRLQVGQRSLFLLVDGLRLPRRRLRRRRRPSPNSSPRSRDWSSPRVRCRRTRWLPGWRLRYPSAARCRIR